MKTMLLKLYLRMLHWTERSTQREVEALYNETRESAFRADDIDMMVRPNAWAREYSRSRWSLYNYRRRMENLERTRAEIARIEKLLNLEPTT